jgi:cyclopropane fatty-acyl-phospholipid synthase-like methyltransferase
MRTAEDFDSYYAVADPWDAKRAKFRDRTFRRFLPDLIRGRTVLELGCGEGHLTEALFSEARAITAIDISRVAIERAKARNLTNARFEIADFLAAPFSGYDIITAIECVYYLAPDEQDAFFAKVAREHAGKTLILSGPIIGDGQHRRYFTHAQLVETFARYRMMVVSYHNLRVHRSGTLTMLTDWLARAIPQFLDWLPSTLIFQRCYIIRIT